MIANLDRDITLNSNILAVEDSLFVLMAIQKILTGKHRVQIAQSAEAAYKLLEKGIPDLILLDLEMPKENGYDILKKLKDNEKWKDIPVIFLTGADSRQKEDTALNMGAVDYILKPIMEGVLLKRIKLHLEFALYKKDLENLVDSRTRQLLEVQNQLQQTAEIAEKSLRVKDAVLATISHEIRTPMNSIIGFAELALDNGLEPRIRDYLNKIMINSSSLLRVVDNLLNISEMEGGGMSLEEIPFDLNDLFNHCKKVISPSAVEKGLELHCSAKQPEGKIIVGDPARLLQVLLDFLTNAVKFTDEGTVSLTAKSQEIDENNARVVFEVKDSGIGMTPEEIQKIYEPLGFADPNTAGKYGGTGLGLLITKNILDFMQSELKVTSKPNAGSTFSFELTFPTIVAPQKLDAYEFAGDKLEKPIFDGEVLLCEDDQMNRKAILEHFERVGLKVAVAKNGKEGVELVQKRIDYKEKPFDLIFMDMQMPVMDGIEASSLIAATGIETPIIAMTANIMPSDMELYKCSGIPDCVGKPFTSQDLCNCLLKYLTPVSWETVSLSTQTEKDKAMIHKLKIDFVKHNQYTYDEIATAVSDGDVKLAMRLAHTLKSTAGLIEEASLQQVAAEIEGILKEDADRLTAGHMNLLEYELNEVLEKLEPMLREEAKQAVAKVLNKEQSLLLLENLEPMLKNSNPECMELLDDIIAVPGAEKLAMYVENFDFAEALEALRELKASF